MPTPRRGESRQDFVGRCIGELVSGEGRSQEQAAAICFDIWRSRNKRGGTGIELEDGRVVRPGHPDWPADEQEDQP